MSSGKNRVKASEAMRQAEANLEGNLTTADDVWFKACEAADLELEQLVPVQHQRHLIASWAGVAAGVRYAVKQLRDEIDKAGVVIRGKDDKIHALQTQLERKNANSWESEKELIRHRVGRVLSDHKIDTSVAALVHEEIAAPAA